MDAGERLRELEVKMEQVQEGVANFRNFQVEARNFFSRADERAIAQVEKDKKRARIHFALLSGLISLVIGLFLWAISWTTSFEQRHHVTQDAPPGVSSTQPQDSQIPPMTR